MSRWVAAGLALAIAAGAGCKKEPAGGAARAPLRLGLFPNLTHAQALVGNGEGLFARESGGR